jgi:hypothetical protein
LFPSYISIGDVENLWKILKKQRVPRLPDQTDAREPKPRRKVGITTVESPCFLQSTILVYVEPFLPEPNCVDMFVMLLLLSGAEPISDEPESRTLQTHIASESVIRYAWQVPQSTAPDWGVVLL